MVFSFSFFHTFFLFSQNFLFYVSGFFLLLFCVFYMAKKENMVDDIKKEERRRMFIKKSKSIERTIYDFVFFHKSLLGISAVLPSFPLINIYEVKTKNNREKNYLCFLFFLLFCCRTTRSSTQLYHNQHFNDIDEFTLLGGI